jgi:uncharacterized damage-inducible protein DinB
MPPTLSLEDLIDYTDWERAQWHEFLSGCGDHVLSIGVGSNGDGRFQSVGEVIRHIFSAETRYIDRLSGRELTNSSAIPTDSLEALFQFGTQSRRHLREFIAEFPDAQWEKSRELPLMNTTIQTTPRKIVVHVLLHEIRHWPQIATLLRLNGIAAGFRDYIFSPAGAAAPATAR